MIAIYSQIHHRGITSIMKNDFLQIKFFTNHIQHLLQIFPITFGIYDDIYGRCWIECENKKGRQIVDC